MNVQVPDDLADLVFRPADRSDDAEMRRLNAEAFPANPKTRAEITAWQWWDNPFGETIAHVWEDEGRLVGQYVAYRMPASFDGAPGRIAIGVDYAIAKSHRGRGLGKPMLDACFGQATDEGTPFYSLPNQLSVGGATRSGLSIVSQLEVRVLPTDASALAERIRSSERVQAAGPLGSAAATLGGIFARVPVRALGARVHTAPGHRTVVTSEPPEEVDGLWSSLSHHHLWGVARRGDWWRWRYAEHPDRPYRIVSVHRNGALVGCSAVITRDDLGGRFHCLLELVAMDGAAARAIVDAVRSGAVGQADGIACTAMPGSRLSGLAAAAGLVRIPPRLLPRPVYFGVVPHPTIIPDPTTVSWSTAWGDLDHI